MNQLLSKMETYKLNNSQDNVTLNNAYNRITWVYQKIIDKEVDLIKNSVSSLLYTILDDRISELINQYRLALKEELSLIYNIDETVWEIVKLSDEKSGIIIPNNNWKPKSDINQTSNFQVASFKSIKEKYEELIKLINDGNEECISDSIQVWFLKWRIWNILIWQKELWYYLAIPHTKMEGIEENPNRISEEQFIELASTFYVHQYLNNKHEHYKNSVDLFWQVFIVSYI